MKKFAKKGFTLLELIVVLLILGILAVIAIPTYSQVQANSLERSVTTTAQSIVRDAQAIASSDASQGVFNDADLETAVSEAPISGTWDAASNTYVEVSGSHTATVVFDDEAGTFTVTMS